ncbi:hypothetical protein KL949_003811 [Ogataea haglerorum]|nr:hypothetical protein KL913_003728 [Ogataea haglerorum]KAG7716520.1 hypothetical protein KL949_003811 [Ogataea haglerorum]KAG7755398.1 hypothetical protein KL947_004244 [Ogataea haglerorum]
MYRATFGSLFSREAAEQLAVAVGRLVVLEHGRVQHRVENGAEAVEQEAGEEQRRRRGADHQKSADNVHEDGEQQGKPVSRVDHGGLLAEVVGELPGEHRVEHEQDGRPAQHREPETETEVSGRPLELKLAVDRPDDACPHGGRKHEDFDDDEFHDRPARGPVDVAARVAPGDPQQLQRRANSKSRLGSTDGRHSSARPAPQFPRARFRQKQNHQHESGRMHQHGQHVELERRQRHKRPRHRAQSEPDVEKGHEHRHVRRALRFLHNVDQIAVGEPHGNGHRAGQRAQEMHRQIPRRREPCLVCPENQSFQTPGHHVDEDVVHEQRLAPVHVAEVAHLDAHEHRAHAANQVLPPLDARAELLACGRAAADHPVRMFAVVVAAHAVERERELLALLEAQHERRDEHHHADHGHRRPLVPHQPAVVAQVLQHEVHVGLSEVVVAVAGCTRAPRGRAVLSLVSRNRLLQHVVLEISIEQRVVERHPGAERAVRVGAAVSRHVLPFWRAEQSVCLLVHSNSGLEMR